MLYVSPTSNVFQWQRGDGGRGEHYRGPSGGVPAEVQGGLWLKETPSERGAAHSVAHCQRYNRVSSNFWSKEINLSQFNTLTVGQTKKSVHKHLHNKFYFAKVFVGFIMTEKRRDFKKTSFHFMSISIECIVQKRIL